MPNPEPSPNDSQRQLEAWEQSLAILTASGTDEKLLAPLKEQIAALRQQVDTAGGAYVAGSVTAQGDFVGHDKTVVGDEVHGDKVMGNKIVTSDTSPDELLRLYLRSLAGDCCRLPLGVIHKEFIRTGDETPIPLPDVYVDLDVVAALDEQAANQRAWALRLARGQEGERRPLLVVLAEKGGQRAVLLGDPGSGKTTFVNYLTYLLATGSAALPPVYAGLLPFRLVLREAVSRRLAGAGERATAQVLWEALGDDLAARLGSVAAEKLLPHLQARIAESGAFVLLDGLDEVPAYDARRAALVSAVSALASSLGLPQGKSRILVTARPYAYADKAWRMPGFAVLGLAPFNEDQVDRFVGRWYGAVRASMKWSETTARNKAERLTEALRERDYLADLASRPLLLTLMATLHSSEGGQLPEDRADLYEETVKLLLGRWQRERELPGPDGALTLEPAIARALGVGEERVRAALETLAFNVHERQRSNPVREGPADIGEDDLLRAFRPLLGKLGPDELLMYLRDRSGILVALRQETYAFPHRSFQEYLAACHLAGGADFAQRLRELAWSDPTWWREVCLLGAGKARQGGFGAALNVVNTFIRETVDEVSEPCAEHWRLAALAGKALVECVCWRRPGNCPTPR